MNKKHMPGFTLIELMIVVAIVAIIASIAYPSYQTYVTKTHRANSAASLLELSQFMEKLFTETGVYTGTALPFTQSPNDGSSAKYNIAVARTATAYTLTATPAGAQANNDANCGALTINSIGVKCINNSTTQCSNSTTASVTEAVADCW